MTNDNTPFTLDDYMALMESVAEGQTPRMRRAYLGVINGIKLARLGNVSHDSIRKLAEEVIK